MTLIDQLKFQYDDGGRKEAGYKGYTRDCVVRAVAIAAHLDYRKVYDTINFLCKIERKRFGRIATIRRRINSGKFSARTGVSLYVADMLLLEHLGWEWTRTIQIGVGYQVRLRAGELPNGRIIASVLDHHTYHYVAVDRRHGCLALPTLAGSPLRARATRT